MRLRPAPTRSARRRASRSSSASPASAEAKCSHSARHETSSAGKLNSSTIGRAELRLHPVDAQRLRAVRADEAVDLQLRGAAVDLEREHVLPLRPGDVQQRPGRRALDGVAEQQRGVVLDRRVPELRAQKRRVQRQRPGEPVDEVEQVHALVDQLATARPRRVGAPLAVVAEAPAVAVARADVHELAVLARVHLGGGARERRMEAVVEADLDESRRAARRRAISPSTCAVPSPAGFSTSTCAPASSACSASGAS